MSQENVCHILSSLHLNYKFTTFHTEVSCNIRISFLDVLNTALQTLADELLQKLILQIMRLRKMFSVEIL